MSATPSRIELLELDVDMRMANIWAETAAFTAWNLDTVSAFIRAAYAKGYCDALKDGGELCRDHGYQVPERTS